MRMIRAALLALALVLAAPVAAQDSFGPADLLDLAEDRTLTFTRVPDGGVVGVERFLGRDRTIWTQPDGRCAYGRISVKGDQICFAYDDDPPGTVHCWFTFLEDGVPQVLSVLTGEVQRISRVTREHLGCEGEPLA